MRSTLFAAILALSASLILGIFLIQRNDHVRNQVINSLLTLLDRELETKIEAEEAHINCFNTTITLDRGSVKPHKFPKTTWGFRQAKIKFGFWDLILKRKISLYLSFEETSGLTTFKDGKLELIDHIIDLCALRETPIKVAIKRVTVNNGIIDTNCTIGKARVNFTGAFDLQKTMRDNQKTWVGSVSLQNTDIEFNGNKIASGINGSNIFYQSKADPYWHITLHNSIARLGQDDETKDYVFTGSWYKQSNAFILQEKNKPFSLRASVTDNNTKIDGTLPIAKAIELGNLLYNSQLNAARAAGLCHIHGNFHVDDKQAFQVQGNLSLTDAHYQNFSFKQLELKNVTIDDEFARATIVIDQALGRHFGGNIYWHFTKQQGVFDLVNSAPLSLSAQNGHAERHWQINASDASLHGTIDADGNIKADYLLTLQHPLTDQQRPHQGSLTYQNNIFTLRGASDESNYGGSAACNPTLLVNEIYCTHLGTGEKFLDLTIAPNQKLIGHIKYGFLQQILPEQIKNSLFGKNNQVGISINQPYSDGIVGSLWLKNAKFYIPHFHNLIKNAHADFIINPINRTLTLDNVELIFSKGRITTPQLFVALSEDLTCKQLHTQLAVNNVLMNVKKDFYGSIYGNILLQKKPEKNFLVAGNVVLKKALIKGDLFSDDVEDADGKQQAHLFHELSKDLDFLVKVSNEQSIKIKTSSMETNAHVDLLTSYHYSPATLQLPNVAGTITLEGGFLKFLENRLMIEHGKIQFLTQQIDDPIVDLVARNRINKYVVSLQVTGSLQKPTVLLESTPELSEEQILGLLLTGSENATLQTDLPVMIMQNLNTILLGQKKSSDPTSVLLEKLSKPLKYVQFTPSFTDQTGYQGVKAQISVPLNKQLRAQLQKNLTLQDDLLDGVSFQVEYLVSDDVSFKVLRGQRGEVGLELEVCFKL